MLRGQETVWLRKDPTPPTRERKKRRPAGETVAITDAGERVFERLRALRFRLAKSQGVPPYVIFSDRTLREMAEAVPDSLDAMRAVSGVGEAKLARYGEAFLEALGEE